MFSLVVNSIVYVFIVQSILKHLESFHIPTLQMFIVTSGSLTRLVYELFSDCQYHLLFFVLTLFRLCFFAVPGPECLFFHL